jgi:heat shock protein HslJ
MKKNLFFLMLLGAMASCGNAPKNNENNEAIDLDSSAVTVSDETAGVDARPVPFEALDGKWMIKSAKSVAVAEGDTSAYVILNVAEKTINATVGCNSIFGAINRNGRAANSLAFENMGATKMMCPDKDSLEMALIDALNNTRSFTLSNGELTFSNEKDEVVLKAAK